MITSVTHKEYEILQAKVLRALDTDDRAVAKAVYILHGLQTADERAEKGTKHRNHIGFNRADAELLTKYAEQINAWWDGKSNFSAPLSRKQVTEARRRVRKYVKQLMLFAVAKSRGQHIKLLTEA